MPVPSALSDLYLTDLLVLGPDNVWIWNYHWNGRSWREYRLPRKFSVLQVTGVRGRNNIWATGFGGRGQRADVYRLINGTWRHVVTPHPDGYDEFAVAESTRNVYLAVATHRQGLSDVVLHWNGRHWRTLPAMTIPGFITPVAAAAHGGLWASNSDLWNGHAWEQVFGPGHEVLVSGNAIAAIPGTRSAWMVGGWCTSARCPARSSRDVMINGPLP